MTYHHTHCNGSGGLKRRGRCVGCDQWRKDNGLGKGIPMMTHNEDVDTSAAEAAFLREVADAEIAKSERELRMLAKIYFPNSTKTDRRKFANIATSLLLKNMLKAVDTLNGIVES